MKQLHLLFVSIFLTSLSATAQISKGMFFIGADLSGSLSKTEIDGDVITRQHSFNLGPHFGKVVKDNLLLGGRLAYGVYKGDTGPSTFQTVGHTYQAGVFLRKYMPLGKSGFYFFGQSGLNFLYQQHDVEQAAPNIDKSKMRTVFINLYPGVSYAVTKRLHLETSLNNLFSLNYQSNTRLQGPESSPTEIKNYGLSFSTSVNNEMENALSLGMRWFFGRAHQAKD